MPRDSEIHDAAAGPQSSPPGRFGRMLRRATFAVGMMTLAGVVIRLTVKDSLPIFSTLYYATPLPLLTVGALWCAVWCWRSPQRRFAAEWTLLTVLLGLWTYSVCWRSHAPNGSEQEKLTVLFWNVARHDDLTAAAAYIRRADPDIVGLVEVKGSARDRREFWMHALPGYDISILGSGMQLLTKGTAGEASPHQLHGNSECRELEVTIRGRRIHCIVVDIESDVFRSRRTALEQLAVRAAVHHDEPVLIMGDFNTPPDSIHFSLFRESLRQLFDACGSGYAPTWPVPWPVLQLDQIWINEHAEGVSCIHGWSRASDHRPVHAVIGIKE